MKSDQYKQSRGERHQAIWELLPWYVNDTLGESERNRVAQHIAECKTCEEEILRYRTIAAAVRTNDSAAWSPSPERVSRIMARVDAQSDAPSRKSRWVALREWFEETRLAFQKTPPPFRWALAAQTAVIAMLAAAFVLQASSAPSLLYRTLSDPGAGTEPRSALIQVVFAEDTTEREIRTLLSTTGAAIVAGPSPMAVYTLSIAADNNEDRTRLRETLSALRAHPKVRLAEPKEP